MKAPLHGWLQTTAVAVGLHFLFTLAPGCARSPSDREVERLAGGCSLAASTFFILRIGAGEFTRAQADQMSFSTDDDARNCAPNRGAAECCAAARRIKRRLAGVSIALCNDLFAAVRRRGCDDLP